MQKAIFIGLTIGLLAAAAHSILANNLASRLFPLDHSVLKFNPIDLGDLNTNVTQEFEVELINDGWHSLKLNPPSTTCGCIALDSQELLIPAKDKTSLRLRLRTPTAPGSLEKSITLVARDHADIEWVVPVRANVRARAWAIPSDLRLESTDKRPLSATVFLHHIPGTNIGQIVSTSEAVTHKSRMLDADLIALDIQIAMGNQKQSVEGNAELIVFAEVAGDELLRIPLSWRQRSIMGCVPNKLVLEKSGDVQKKRVMVLCQSKTLQITPLVPWSQGEVLEKLPSGVLIQVAIDAEAMPPDFDGKILKLSGDGEGVGTFISASR